MKKNRLFCLIVLMSLCLSSCDAYLRLGYSVKNKSKETIKLYVRHYPCYGAEFSFEQKDTIIEIKPGNRVMVGVSAPEIGFPWSIKKIYNNYPGICELQIIKPDTNIRIKCTKKEWRYWRGVSTYSYKKL